VSRTILFGKQDREEISFDTCNKKKSPPRGEGIKLRRRPSTDWGLSPGKGLSEIRKKATGQG